MHWLAYLLGITSPNQWPYLLWSGVAGYLILAATNIRHRNCQARWCWRLGRHSFDLNGTEHTLCRRHHPQLPDRAPTAQQINDAAKGPDEQ